MSSQPSATKDELSHNIAVYTGSFDPVTLGHLHIIERASKLFDTLVIGIGINADKKSLFNPDERIELVQRICTHLPNVQVQTFDGLAVDFVRSLGAGVMVRGIRPLTDIAGEFTMMMANRQLDADIETVFLMADERFAHVSSSLLKQIAALSEDDDHLAKFVPRAIIPSLRAKLTALPN
ncbi:pantetheine-phosphate adenylyltransferase [Rhodopirellula sp. JC740]|uniref:Phosphopantetheine adenylyltransferase n=1 Tax=Rhodopirellula halodulae TaxID=2894198 RepID=A0ABS8NJI7_9BACT|nr:MULTISPECIES: pantetheine-phosphate adenylyltransferase [unclassified Rhodopirellula]MCC9643554.1 pantetheine-phosphate adenylyltransferase [Rhodopirellula sp. JC740]MCC9654248.1 pantetheine-phosphate adenylyltransferase [Rhodopirellula sp. JC737]